MWTSVSTLSCVVPLMPGAVSLAPPNLVHRWCGSTLPSVKPLTSGTPFTGPGPAAGFGFLAFVGAGFSVTGLIVGGIGRGSTNGVLGGLMNGMALSAWAQ